MPTCFAQLVRIVMAVALAAAPLGLCACGHAQAETTSSAQSCCDLGAAMAAGSSEAAPLEVPPATCPPGDCSHCFQLTSDSLSNETLVFIAPSEASPWHPAFTAALASALPAAGFDGGIETRRSAWPSTSPAVPSPQTRRALRCLWLI